jgi:hypothetical protein
MAPNALKESLWEIEKVLRPEGFEAGSSEQTSRFARRKKLSVHVDRTSLHNQLE